MEFIKLHWQAIAIVVILFFFWLSRKARKHREEEAKYTAGGSAARLEYRPLIDAFPNLSAQEIAEKIRATNAEPDEKIAREKALGLLPFFIEKTIDDGIITEKEQDKLHALLEIFNLEFEKLPRAAQIAWVKGLTVRDLINGVPAEHATFANVPFKIMKTERVVWVFQNVPVYEVRTVKERKGSYSGASFRVAKGIYWHTGGSRGHTIEKQVTQSLGTSHVAVTSKHIYFETDEGTAKRIKHEKVISVTPDAGGVLLQRDGARSNPLYFATDDSWFMANIMQNGENWDV